MPKLYTDCLSHACAWVGASPDLLGGALGSQASVWRKLWRNCVRGEAAIAKHCTCRVLLVVLGSPGFSLTREGRYMPGWKQEAMAYVNAKLAEHGVPQVTEEFLAWKLRLVIRDSLKSKEKESASMKIAPTRGAY
jgi:hypothetical protein